MMDVRVVPASPEAASADGRPSGAPVTGASIHRWADDGTNDKNSKQEFKRMKKGNVHDQEAVVTVRLRRLHVSCVDRRRIRPGRELRAGHRAAVGKPGALQLDAVPADL